MKIKITTGSHALMATLDDNATARDFASLLPLSLTMNDLFGRQKYAGLPRRLKSDGPRSYQYEVGEIAYWPPSHDLAIYYHQDGEVIPKPGILRIGMLDNGADAFHVPGPVRVTIEAAE